MPKILVKLYTTLKDRLNTPKIWLEGNNAQEVLLALKEAKKPDVEDVLFDGQGIVKNHFVLTLNSRILDHKKTAQEPVKDGDVMHIFPPVSGG